MKQIFGGIAFFFIVLFFILGLVWIVEGNNFFMFKFWSPKYEDVKRDVYTHTQSYRQGSIQRLDSLCLQEKTADADHKPMINDVINQEFAEWSMNDIPDHLQSCLSNARQ